ncbi:MAG: MOSC domain-containing protein [Chloroflexota bacterium]
MAALGEVVTIHTVRERNGVAEPLAMANVVTDYGIEGDWRSRRDSGRQLTLIEEDALVATGRELGRPVPPGASRRQVVVRGLSLNETVGKTLRAGDLVLAVSSLCDPCDNMEVMIGPGARVALANRGGVCARVLQGGSLRSGDAIHVEDERHA